MLFIVTGGTIDKMPVYLPDGSFDNDSKLFGETHVPDMLEKANYLGERTVRQLFMLDSLDMTDDHREVIKITAEESSEDKVVLLMGRIQCQKRLVIYRGAGY